MFIKKQQYPCRQDYQFCRRNTENSQQQRRHSSSQHYPHTWKHQQIQDKSGNRDFSEKLQHHRQSHKLKSYRTYQCLCPFFLRSCKGTDLFRSEPHSQNTAKGQKKSAVQEIGRRFHKDHHGSYGKSTHHIIDPSGDSGSHGDQKHSYCTHGGNTPSGHDSILQHHSQRKNPGRPDSQSHLL